jgi:hypothetical protein
MTAILLNDGENGARSLENDSFFQRLRVDLGINDRTVKNNFIAPQGGPVLHTDSAVKSL